MPVVFRRPVDNAGFMGLKDFENDVQVKAIMRPTAAILVEATPGEVF